MRCQGFKVTEKQYRRENYLISWIAIIEEGPLYFFVCIFSWSEPWMRIYLLRDSWIYIFPYLGNWFLIFCDPWNMHFINLYVNVKQQLLLEIIFRFFGDFSLNYQLQHVCLEIQHIQVPQRRHKALKKLFHLLLWKKKEGSWRNCITTMTS